jgi:exosome complex component RRP45
VDGRAVFDFRPLKITFGEEFGTVYVQVGRTSVFAKTTCHITEPYGDRPTEGFFTFNVEFSPMASKKYESGRVSAHGIELIRVVERGLRESRAVDTEALCIIAGEKVWSVRTDIYILDDNGNLMDTCSIAAITSLHHFRRPDLTIDGSNVIVHSPTERELVPLSIHHIPITISFGIFNEGETIIVDPEWKEEKIQSGRISMTLNAHRELCAIQKAGGVPLSVEDILQIARIAQVKVLEITQVIQQALSADKKDRNNKISNIMVTTGIGTQQDVNGQLKFFDGIKSTTLDVNHDPYKLAFPDQEAQKEFDSIIGKLKRNETVEATEEFFYKMDEEMDEEGSSMEQDNSDSGSVQEVAVNSENNGADDSSEEEPQTTTQLESEFAPAQTPAKTPAKKPEPVAPQSDSKKNPSPAKAQDTPKQQTSAQPKHKPLAGTKKNAGSKPKLTFTPKAKK